MYGFAAHHTADNATLLTLHAATAALQRFDVGLDATRADELVVDQISARKIDPVHEHAVILNMALHHRECLFCRLPLYSIDINGS